MLQKYEQQKVVHLLSVSKSDYLSNPQKRSPTCAGSRSHDSYYVSLHSLSHMTCCGINRL